MAVGEGSLRPVRVVVMLGEVMVARPGEVGLEEELILSPVGGWVPGRRRVTGLTAQWGV